MWKAACSDTTQCYENQPSPSAPTATTTTTTAPAGQISNPWSPVDECPSVEASDGNYDIVFPILTTLIFWLLLHKIGSNINDFKNAYQNECFFFGWSDFFLSFFHSNVFHSTNNINIFEEMTSVLINIIERCTHVRI